MDHNASHGYWSVDYCFLICSCTPSEAVVLGRKHLRTSNLSHWWIKSIWCIILMVVLYFNLNKKTQSNFPFSFLLHATLHAKVIQTFLVNATSCFWRQKRIQCIVDGLKLFQKTLIPSLGWDWGTPHLGLCYPPAGTGVLPPIRNWSTPQERTWDQTPGKEPGTGVHPVNRQTDACENITFVMYVGGKNFFSQAIQTTYSQIQRHEEGNTET